jgi:hypothetical protein
MKYSRSQIPLNSSSCFRDECVPLIIVNLDLFLPTFSVPEKIPNNRFFTCMYGCIRITANLWQVVSIAKLRSFPHTTPIPVRWNLMQQRTSMFHVMKLCYLISTFQCDLSAVTGFVLFSGGCNRGNKCFRASTLCGWANTWRIILPTLYEIGLMPRNNVKCWFTLWKCFHSLTHTKLYYCIVGCS